MEGGKRKRKRVVIGEQAGKDDVFFKRDNLGLGSKAGVFIRHSESKHKKKRLDNIERLLKYIMIYLHNSKKDYVVDNTYVKIKRMELPDISDIIKEMGIFK